MQYLKDWGNHLHIPEHDSLRPWCSKGHVRGCPVSGLRRSHLYKVPELSPWAAERCRPERPAGPPDALGSHCCCCAAGRGL